MKNINKTINFNTHPQNRLMAFITLLAITTFAPHNSWAALQPAARGASIATQRAAQQLYPTLAPAGLPSRGGAPAQASESAAGRAQRLEQERAFERRRQTAARWLEQKRTQEARDAQVAQESQLRSRPWAQRAAGPRTMGTGLMRPIPSPFAGTGMVSRSFSSKNQGSLASYLQEVKNRLPNTPEYDYDIQTFPNLAQQVGSQAKAKSPLLANAIEDLPTILQKLPENIRLASKTATAQSAQQNEPASLWSSLKKRIGMEAKLSPEQALLNSLFDIRTEGPDRQYDVLGNFSNNILGAFVAEIEAVARDPQQFNMTAWISRLESICQNNGIRPYA